MKNLPRQPQIGKRRHPLAVEAGRDHNWNTAQRKRLTQPTWLNGGDTGKRTCLVCGVEEVNNFIMADHAGFGDEGKQLLKGKPTVEKYTYVDIKGNQFTSMVSLGCPTFMLDHKGTTMENKERVRRVDDRVDGVEDRVDSTEDRIAVLEEQNTELRNFIENQMVSAITEIVDQQVTARLEAMKVEVVELPQTVEGEVVEIVDTEVIDAEVIDEEEEVENAKNR